MAKKKNNRKGVNDMTNNIENNEQEVQLELNLEEQPEVEFAVTNEEDAVHVRPVVDGEIIDTPIEQVIEPEEDTEEVTSTEETEKSEESKETEVESEVEPEVHNTGVVTANKLNVRKEPSKESEVLCIIEKDEEVTLSDEEASYEDFYKVITSTGVEGYCVKEYINIK